MLGTFCTLYIVSAISTASFSSNLKLTFSPIFVNYAKSICVVLVFMCSVVVIILELMYFLFCVLICLYYVLYMYSVAMVRKNSLCRLPRG